MFLANGDSELRSLIFVLNILESLIHWCCSSNHFLNEATYRELPYLLCNFYRNLNYIAVVRLNASICAISCRPFIFPSLSLQSLTKILALDACALPFRWYRQCISKKEQTITKNDIANDLAGIGDDVHGILEFLPNKRSNLLLLRAVFGGIGLIIFIIKLF